MEKLRKVLKLLNPDRPQSEAELSVEINKQDQDHEAFLGRTGRQPCPYQNNLKAKGNQSSDY